MKIQVLALSAGSALLVLGIVVSYFSKVAEAKLSHKIGGWVVSLMVGLATAVASIVWGLQSGSLGAAVIAPASLAIALSSGMLYLFSLRKTPVGELKVKVGDKLLPFSATTSEGVAFQSEELADRRILFKFFRGGW